jgi:hypothetical protein
MDALVLIFIWLCNLTARAIAAILRHILIFDSFVIALFTGFWLHMERGWGLVAVWMLGIVIFFALVALSAQKVTAIILSVIATAFWTISSEEIWRGLFYSSQEPFGSEKLIVWSIIFLIVNAGAHVLSYKRLRFMIQEEEPTIQN